MKAALENLFRAVAPSDVRGIGWDSVFVVRSSGALRHPDRAVDRNLADRGFHFIGFTGQGRPRFYCKVRPAMPGGRHREGEVLDVFTANDQSRPFVPIARTASDGIIELQYAEYFDGITLDRRTVGFDTGARLELAARVLDAAGQLCLVASAAPDVFDTRPAELLAETSDALDDLAGKHVSAEDRSLIRDILRDCPDTPGVPQHGDFWPQNVLLDADSRRLCIVDLNAFGELRVPLYDTAHFLRTADDVWRPGAPGRWVERMLRDDPYAAAYRRLLERDRRLWGLSHQQTVGCLLYYLADIGVRTASRGAPEIFWGRFRDEVPAIAALLREHSPDALGRRLTAS